MKLSKDIASELRCPNCLNTLTKTGSQYECSNLECKLIFPVVNDIPILIYEKLSVFNIQDFVEKKDTTFELETSLLYKISKKLVPSISKNIKAKENYNRLINLLIGTSNNSNVLVIGGSTLGEGMESIVLEPKINLIESDVTFGPRTQIIFDAHNIPFPNEYFDCVIIQAVLEHVVDPFKCVQDVHRVLKKDGLVYAETPFMAQVHMGKYDFHRFSHLAHRRLFKNFAEIDSGAVSGPGVAFAWTYSYVIYSFFKSKKMRKYLIPFAHFTSFFWKYFDYLLIDKPGTFDAALGYYFMGKKSEEILDDRELLKLYKGLL